MRTKIYEACASPRQADLDETAQLIADQMNRIIEGLVRERPEDWIYWRGLGSRWQAASDILNGVPQ